MSLDLKKVLSQIKNLENQNSSSSFLERLIKTFNLFKSALKDQNKLLKKIYETQSNGKANFYFAIPDSDQNINEIVEPDKDFKSSHIITATDGSQINPSAHEFTSACLINTGLIAFPYFKKDVPVTLASEPIAYSSTEEISAFTSESINDEDLISYERTLKEVEELVKLTKSYLKFNLPIVAILDGTLIHWHIEKLNSIYIEKFIERFSNALNELKSLNIPVVSFLSNSRSNDLINMLKISKCIYDEVDCKKHCANIGSKNLPCNPTTDYRPVFDRRIIEKFFKENNALIGSRTSLFRSNSNILNHYENDLKILFFYLNTGTEVARIELPAYVARNKDLLKLVHNAINLQCKVGYGYPSALSEAHNQAVITRSDRELFYELIKKQNINSKSTIKISNKELKKRISFV